MNAVQTNNDRNLFAHIDFLMTEHGVWPLLVAMARAAVQRRRLRQSRGRVRRMPGLSEHILRDIGLHPAYRPDAD